MIENAASSFALVRFILIIILLGVSSWLVTDTQSFSWFSINSRRLNHHHHHRQRPPRQRLFDYDSANVLLLYSTTSTTTLVSSAADVVHLQYTEITPPSLPLPHVQQPSSQQQRQPPSPPPPVIFMHGLLGNKKNFISLGTELAYQLETKRRILAVDLRNHGENHHDWRDSMGHDEMAQDVIALLDRLQFDQVVVVGHSMGGKVAQAMALLFPNRIAGLIVLDMAPVSYIQKRKQLQHDNTDASDTDDGDQYDANWKTIRDILQLLTSVPLQLGMTKRDVDVWLRPHISDAAIRAFCLTNLEMTTTTKTTTTTTSNNEKKSPGLTTTKTTLPRWKIPLSKIMQQLDRLADFDLQQQSSSHLPSTTPSSSLPTSPSSSLVYDGDVFFITGGQSKFVRSVHLPTIQRFFPNHMVSTIRGAGHWVHAEAPDETMALIKRFLDR